VLREYIFARISVLYNTVIEKVHICCYFKNSLDDDICNLYGFTLLFCMRFISGIHLHELLEGSDLHLPEPVVPTRVNLFSL